MSWRHFYTTSQWYCIYTHSLTYIQLFHIYIWLLNHFMYICCIYKVYYWPEKHVCMYRWALEYCIISNFQGSFFFYCFWYCVVYKVYLLTWKHACMYRWPLIEHHVFKAHDFEAGLLTLKFEQEMEGVATRLCQVLHDTPQQFATVEVRVTETKEALDLGHSEAAFLILDCVNEKGSSPPPR